MKDAFGVEVSKGLPSYLRGAVKESDAVGGTNLKVDYMRRRVSAHHLGRQASKYGSVTGKGSALSTGKAMRTRSRKKLIAINNVSKGMPRAARAFARTLKDHPDPNFSAAHEMLNPRNTNYIAYRAASHGFGKEAAKYASTKGRTPVSAEDRIRNRIYSTALTDDGRAFKKAVAPVAAESKVNGYRFEGAGGFGRHVGWKPLLDKSQALKKLPNVTRDNYISQRSAASQAKLKDFIKRRDRKARGEISKSGVGAGRYMRAIDMPAKIRTRHLERLRSRKPLVASIQDQQFTNLRESPWLTDFNYRPKNKGTVVDVGRKRHKVLIHTNKGMKGSNMAGVTGPNPRTNTNHIEVPNKTKTKGRQANTIEHEKVHAQLSPQHIIRSTFRSRNAKFGEEARADAIANLKTGRKRVSSSYPLANNRRYNEVYTQITGRKPKAAKLPKSQRQKDPIKAREMDDLIGMSINESFGRRARNAGFRYVEKPNLP